MRSNEFARHFEILSCCVLSFEKEGDSDGQQFKHNGLTITGTGRTIKKRPNSRIWPTSL